MLKFLDSICARFVAFVNDDCAATSAEKAVILAAVVALVGLGIGAVSGTVESEFKEVSETLNQSLNGDKGIEPGTGQPDDGANNKGVGRNEGDASDGAGAGPASHGNVTPRDGETTIRNRRSNGEDFFKSKTEPFEIPGRRRSH